MPTDRLAELVARLEPVARIGGFLKFLIVAVALGTAWFVTLQLQTANNAAAIVEIRTDRKERIASAEEWRRQKDKEDAARESLTQQIVKIQDRQQLQIDALAAHKP